ncbi:hypothetical protein AC249_AIPGENE12892 [Exaiptasia diaphana]|nr:hypothetical protein AC249_AIPGENE12892 [Exaiptasia diaphana]
MFCPKHILQCIAYTVHDVKAAETSEPFTSLLDFQCIVGSVSRENKRNPPCSVPNISYNALRIRYMT